MNIFRILVLFLGVVAAHWKLAKVAGNAPAGDEVFLRRIYLDLAGRIPTAAVASLFPTK